MRSKLSSLVIQIKPSGIRRFFDLAETMDGVISLGVGEPDFITPWSICHASIQSIERGYTSYTEREGLLDLRKEISSYMKNRFQVTYSPYTDILVTVGGSQALDISLRTVLNPGEEVIMIEPSYVAYAPLITLAGGKPVLVQTSIETEFKPQPEQIRRAITEKTKAILICSPNNPTGSLLNEQELKSIAEIAISHDLLVITDEIYAELSYDDSFCSIASIAGMRERTIIVSGFSKGFAMTGWRLGYICAPEFLTQAILRVMQNTLVSVPSMSQYGAIEGLRNGKDHVIEMRKSYRQRRNLVVSHLNEMGLKCHLPGGAFYVFPSIRSTGLSSEEFAEQLLINQKVAVVPGNAFGESGEGHIRCSYASSMDNLNEAMKRMRAFLESIK
ncbi:aminotransferase [Bacillus sp. DNRA2]|uniref:aminotransferase n=1 Tax=Bacillus sp. DNRA2 TaxID=2723053 RepID=UPI00145D5397|nr:aminotransferase [Bacillus sp. DNRA2]NMD72418.1 aminotransferase [Bacillus sp. DNRA2]